MAMDDDLTLYLMYFYIINASPPACILVKRIKIN